MKRKWTLAGLMLTIAGIACPISRSDAASPAAAAVPSYQAQSDLWGFAQRALASGQPAQLFEGYAASRECLGIAGMVDELTQIASGGAQAHLPQPVTPQRQVAIHQVMSKCQGFIRAGVPGSRELLRSLRAAGQEQGAAEFDALQSSASSSLPALLFSDSPAAREAALPLLLKEWPRLQGIAEPSDHRADLIGVAALLATCELGRDCSQAGYGTQLQCALSGRCTTTLWEGWDAPLSAEDQTIVAAYRAQLLRAVKTKNLHVLSER